MNWVWYSVQTPESERDPAEIDEDKEEEAPPLETERTSRDVLYEAIGVELMNAGLRVPAAEFIAAVRRAAGFRVSPRQIATAVQELARAEQPIDVDAVAGVVQAAKGAGAERQHRHAEQWRALGSALALRGIDGSPAGQRAFIGVARRIAGRDASDLLLLTVALAISGERQVLDPATVGRVTKQIAPFSHDLSPDQIADRARRELRNPAHRPWNLRPSRNRKRSSRPPRQTPPPRRRSPS